MKKILLLFLVVFATLTTPNAQNNCEEALGVTIGLTSVVGIVGDSLTLPNCIDSDDGTRGMWYVFTAPADTTVMVSTRIPGVSADTRINVYQGECGNLNCIGGDDDTGTLQSEFTFQATQGESYYFLFDNRWDDGGFFFEISFFEPIEILVTFEALNLESNDFVEATVDMNGDFLDDLVRIDVNGSIDLSYQQADGSFVDQRFDVPPTVNRPDWSLAAGDLDGNGFNDLLYGGFGGVSFMIANEDGTAYTEYTEDNGFIFSQRSNFIDINNDGNLDAFVCHDVEPNVFYINDGENNLQFFQGSLGDVPDGGNYGSIWIDYDNDGDQDLFIAKCRGGGDTPANINELHRNNGDGTFTEVGEEVGLADAIQTWSGAWGDFDLDGDLDLFVGASSLAQGGHKLMRNDDGVFTDVTLGSGLDNLTDVNIETVTHDFNNDGYQDLFGAGRVIWVNNGDMTFTASAVPFGHGPVGDLNNDGFLDVAGGQNFGGASNGIFVGVPNGNNYLKVNLTGTGSNLNGIGARVEIFSRLGHQMREIVSGDGFAFMSSLNAHFGIGSDEVIDSVLVRWPSGIVDVVYEPAINQNLLVVEGSSLSAIDNPSFNQIGVYPNPVADRLMLELVDRTTPITASVFDLSGKMVTRVTVQDAQLNTTNLVNGTYLLVVQQGDQYYRARFIKQ
ncbi:MAG: FG-GAP-like repeat-containing protein [Bacteroidota bacterium]